MTLLPLTKRGNNARYLVVKGGTAQFNPTIAQATIAREMASDPEGARSEWGAEFRADISALLDDQVIEDAIDHGRPIELSPRGSRTYYAFADASAGRHDAFTLCIGHLDGKKGEENFVCDVVRGALAPFDPATVAEEYASLARAYNCRKITGDNFSGEWVAAAFRGAGVEYTTSPLRKSDLHLEALPSFNQGVVSIPNQERLLSELRGLERRVHRSGRDSVDHGAHGSDDFANALCGALYIALHETRKPMTRTGGIGVTGDIWWHDQPRPSSTLYRDKEGNLLLRSSG